MSTPPPEEPYTPPAGPGPSAGAGATGAAAERPFGPGYGGLGRGPTTGAILPVPGNAELAVYLLAELVLAIVWAASDDVGASLFLIVTAVITLGYLISRGIAKAGKVLEQ
jgi:hypothetical protein